MPANNLISGSERLKELLEWKDIKLDAYFFTVGRENIAMQLKDSLSSQYSYPSIIQGNDGSLHCVYTWRRQRIVYKRITF